MLECFCFTQQKLQPREKKDMPLRFVIANALPEKYGTVTLSYTFMDTDRSKAIKPGSIGIESQAKI